MNNKPIEELLLDYASIGRTILSNDYKDNTENNIRCQMCDENMNFHPLTHYGALSDILIIIKKHFLQHGSHLLASASADEYEQFEEDSQIIRPCTGIDNKKKYYIFLKSSIKRIRVGSDITS